MGKWDNCWHLGIDLSKLQILYDGDNDSYHVDDRGNEDCN